LAEWRKRKCQNHSISNGWTKIHKVAVEGLSVLAQDLIFKHLEDIGGYFTSRLAEAPTTLSGPRKTNGTNCGNSVGERFEDQVDLAFGSSRHCS